MPAGLPGLPILEQSSLSALAPVGRPCLPLAERLLREGERRPRALIARVQTFSADFRLLSDLPGSHLFFNNLNSPEDYDAA